jgi:phosphoglycolate phosphatase-like HAD superfamily hydrolase
MGRARGGDMTPATVVFDLDGTLVDSEAFDATLFAEAVREIVADVEVDESWRKYRHVTDEGILMQILEESRSADASAVKARVRETFGSKVSRYLSRGGACECVPGARAALDLLKASGCRVGIATGGWGHTARMKLAHAGISLEGLTVTSSDDSHDRVEIMNACLRRLGGASDRAIYVGDGRWDIEASERAGWQFIGVGEKIKGLCAPWIADFSDPTWWAHVRQLVA